jgi:hypothetical protein
MGRRRLGPFEPAGGGARGHGREQHEIAAAGVGDRRLVARKEHGAVALPAAERIPLGVGSARDE